MKLEKVTVIGASGTMGSNIAGIFASFGNAKVYCVGRDVEKVRKSLPRIVSSVKANSIERNIIPMDFDSLEKCVAKSDLIIESCKEDLSLKIEIAKRVGKAMKDLAISATGTSGLPITSLAEYYPKEKRSRFFGIHFFNPPYSLPLCELIATKYSSKKVKSEIEKYLKSVLYRTVVEVKDTPAFLGNRIGFQFINDALQTAEIYKDNGGIDYVDAILGQFTGRSMSPLMTSDFVGLDVHKAIVDNIYNNTNDYARNTFIFPEFAMDLVNKGAFGRKKGCGLYRMVSYDNGFKRMTVYDINTGYYRDVFPYIFPFAEKMKKAIAEGDYQEAFEQLVNNQSQEAIICMSFLLKYIVYSLYCAKTVGYNIESADDVMASGFNWCPPMALYQALSTVTDVNELVKERLPEVCNRLDVNSYLKDVECSKYDYRLFFKTGR